MLVWNVKNFDCNAQVIRDYNILKHSEDFIKKQKKKCVDRAEFAEVMKKEFMYRFWSKAEHELIIEFVGNRTILSPWCGCREPAKVAVDVTDDPRFDWLSFAKHHVSKQRFSTKAKIDVYDQLAWKWDEFVDYCWYTRLPYERKHQKFEK